MAYQQRTKRLRAERAGSEVWPHSVPRVRRDLTVPSEFICSMSGRIMRDPVLDPDDPEARAVDREAFEAHQREFGLRPLSGLPPIDRAPTLGDLRCLIKLFILGAMEADLEPVQAKHARVDQPDTSQLQLCMSSAAQVNGATSTNAELSARFSLRDGLEVPLPFFCALELQLMDDPVYDSQDPSVSMERAALEGYVKQYGTNPLTGRQMALSDITADRRMQNSIDRFLDKHSGPTVRLHTAPTAAGGGGVGHEHGSDMCMMAVGSAASTVTSAATAAVPGVSVGDGIVGGGANATKAAISPGTISTALGTGQPRAGPPVCNAGMAGPCSTAPSRGTMKASSQPPQAPKASSPSLTPCPSSGGGPTITASPRISVIGDVQQTDDAMLAFCCSDGRSQCRLGSPNHLPTTFFVSGATMGPGSGPGGEVPTLQRQEDTVPQGPPSQLGSSQGGATMQPHRQGGRGSSGSLIHLAALDQSRRAAHQQLQAAGIRGQIAGGRGPVMRVLVDARRDLVMRSRQSSTVANDHPLAGRQRAGVSCGQQPQLKNGQESVMSLLPAAMEEPGSHTGVLSSLTKPSNSQEQRMSQQAETVGAKARSPDRQAQGTVSEQPQGGSCQSLLGAMAARAYLQGGRHGGDDGSGSKSGSGQDSTLVGKANIPLQSQLVPAVQQETANMSSLMTGAAAAATVTEATDVEAATAAGQAAATSEGRGLQALHHTSDQHNPTIKIEDGCRVAASLEKGFGLQMQPAEACPASQRVITKPRCQRYSQEELEALVAGVMEQVGDSHMVTDQLQLGSINWAQIKATKPQLGSRTEAALFQKWRSLQQAAVSGQEMGLLEMPNGRHPGVKPRHVQLESPATGSNVNTAAATVIEVEALAGPSRSQKQPLAKGLGGSRPLIGVRRSIPVASRFGQGTGKQGKYIVVPDDIVIELFGAAVKGMKVSVRVCVNGSEVLPTAYPAMINYITAQEEHCLVDCPRLINALKGMEITGWDVTLTSNLLIMASIQHQQKHMPPAATPINPAMDSDGSHEDGAGSHEASVITINSRIAGK